MSKVEIVLNSDGIRELLKSEDMQNALQEITTGIQGRVAGAYETDVKVMPGRAISSIYTADKQAYQDNLENNTLLKAIQQ